MHLFYNQMTTNQSHQAVNTYNYKVTALIHKLKINKSINFKTKILWKRHQNKVQTKLVNHAHGYSIFNQSIQLYFTLQYDTNKKIFLQKNTQFIPIISIQQNFKSGGYAKIDITQGLNLGFKQITKKIPLLKCPDPQAYLQLTFIYQQIGEGVYEQLSALNASSRDINMSKMQFSEDKINHEMKSIQNTINKFEQLCSKIQRDNKKNILCQYNKNIQILEGQNKQLRRQIQNLEERNRKNQLEWKNQKKQLQKQIHVLEKQLDKKTHEITQKTKQLAYLQQSLKSKIKIDDDSTDEDKNSSKKYQQLYNSMRQKLQEKVSEIQLLQQTICQFQNRLKQYSRQKIEVHYGGQKSFSVSQFGKDSDDQDSTIQKLEREKIELQHQLASTSHKLAQLFNVSFEIGGADLLDKLQSSIGIIQ